MFLGRGFVVYEKCTVYGWTPEGSPLPKGAVPLYAEDREGGKVVLHNYSDTFSTQRIEWTAEDARKTLSIDIKTVDTAK